MKKEKLNLLKKIRFLNGSLKHIKGGMPLLTPLIGFFRFFRKTNAKDAPNSLIVSSV